MEREQDFIAEHAKIMCPAAVYICNGTVFEEEALRDMLVKEGETMKKTPIH